MHAVRIRFGEDTPFIEIDGKGDAARQRQRVETIIQGQPVTFQVEVVIDDLAGTQKRMPGSALDIGDATSRMGVGLPSPETAVMTGSGTISPFMPPMCRFKQAVQVFFEC